MKIIDAIDLIDTEVKLYLFIKQLKEDWRENVVCCVENHLKNIMFTKGIKTTNFITTEEVDNCGFDKVKDYPIGENIFNRDNIKLLEEFKSKIIPTLFDE